MHFSNLKLPESLSFSSSGGIEFATEVVQGQNGAEFRQSKWQYPICRYNLAPSLSSVNKIKLLQAFFRIHKGKAIGFRFKDHLDYKQKDQFIAYSDGKKLEYELFKSYYFDGKTVNRRIFKPIENSVKIFVNDTEVASEIEYDRGVFKLKELPKLGARITANFEFDVPVRFDTDFLSLTADLSKMDQYEIPVIEIKEMEELDMDVEASCG